MHPPCGMLLLDSLLPIMSAGLAGQAQNSNDKQATTNAVAGVQNAIHMSQQCWSSHANDGPSGFNSSLPSPEACGRPAYMPCLEILACPRMLAYPGA